MLDEGAIISHEVGGNFRDKLSLLPGRGNGLIPFDLPWLFPCRRFGPVRRRGQHQEGKEAPGYPEASSHLHGRCGTLSGLSASYHRRSLLRFGWTIAVNGLSCQPRSGLQA